MAEGGKIIMKGSMAGGRGMMADGGRVMMMAGGGRVARWAALLLVGVILSTAFTMVAAIKDAPRRTVQRSSEQKTVTTGQDVKLLCPIDGTPPPIYEWLKNGEVVPEDGWERTRVAGRVLRLREATTADQGIYECSAVNGFGKETYTITLVVIDPLAGSSSAGVSMPGGLPPEFTQLLPPVPGKIDKPVGHNVKLKCQVTGKPEPAITWFKDGVELREGSLGGESRLTKHYLHLYDLRPQDAGTYTCAAANPLGAAAANWTLRVIDQAQPREPEFNPQEPANTTVVAGDSATLQCSGSSEVAPHIKWLRRVEEGSREADHIPDNQTLNWKGHRYIVLQATQVLTPGDGSFYTKLVLPRVKLQDTGIYVCTATNNFGLAYRQALLSVMDESGDSNTLLLIISVGCVGVVMVVVLVVVMVRRSHSTKPPPPSSNESALLPPPLPTQAKMQPLPPHHPRFAPGQHPTPQPGAPHGHSVGPEGPMIPYHPGGVVHLPSQGTMAGSGQGGPPIMVFHDRASAASVYIAQRPPGQPTTVPRPEYQYQHLDVI